ncbi:sulfotransferase domain-containing protein [Kiloniella antarctica]|uniref:Sulfotransferase domain-containing protein n=1 Tax=Kiloniella antarctica TaxID=1550907 RepID=A0ABW5BFL3_9PROT
MPGILWIASYPKSGNTWVRVFLANLILNAEEPLSPNRANEICISEANRVWFKPFLDEKPWEEQTEQEIADVRDLAQRRAVEVNKRVVLLKTHNFLGEFLDKPLCSMRSTAAAIYIVRDPRDVAVSGADHFGVSIDETIELMAKTGARSEADENLVYEIYNSWSNHVKSWSQVKHQNLIVIRYEDMLGEPHKVFIALAKKLGITQDDERIKRAVEFSSFKQLQALEAEKGFIERSHKSEKFFRSGKAGGWREVLTDKQRYRIEKDHKTQMKKFGYL